MCNAKKWITIDLDLYWKKIGYAYKQKATDIKEYSYQKGEEKRLPEEISEFGYSKKDKATDVIEKHFEKDKEYSNERNKRKFTFTKNPLLRFSFLSNFFLISFMYELEYYSSIEKKEIQTERTALLKRLLSPEMHDEIVTTVLGKSEDHFELQKGALAKLYEDLDSSAKDLEKIKMQRFLLTNVKTTIKENRLTVEFDLTRKGIIVNGPPKHGFIHYDFEIKQKGRQIEPIFPNDDNIVTLKVTEAEEHISYVTEIVIDGQIKVYMPFRSVTRPKGVYEEEMNVLWNITNFLRTLMEKLSRGIKLVEKFEYQNHQTQGQVYKLVNIEYIYSLDDNFETILKKHRNFFSTKRQYETARNDQQYKVLYIYKVDTELATREELKALFGVQGIPLLFHTL